MSPVRLRSFRNSWYCPGRSIFWQLGWFFLGLPLLRSSLIPSSAFRVRILRLFGATIGDGVVIKPGVRVKYPWRLAVGDACWLGEDCWIDNLADVCIGNNVCVSQGTYFCTGNHDWTDSSFGLIVKPITLQDGSWAGAKAILAPGVTLGECAIASAGSVVTKNIPPYEIHGGNPAVFLKQRHVESQRLNFEFSIEEQVAS